MASVDAADAEPVKTTSESRLKALLRAAAQYSAGSMVQMVTSIARVGVTARVLSEAEVGAWLGLQLLLSYAGNLHLGSLYGVYRSVPMMRARGDDEDAEREKNTAFAFLLLMTVVGTLGLFLLAPVVSTGTTTRHVLLTMALLVATLLRMYWSTVLRAESRFKELSVAWVLGSAVAAPGLALIVWWKLDGVLVAMLAQAIVETGYLAIKSGVPRVKLELPLLKGQLRVGIMTLGTTVGTLALTTADRTIMLKLCGAAQTGLYYLGANIVTLLPTLALIPTAVLTPKFFERAGRGEDLMPLVERPLKLMSVFVAVLCGSAAAILPAVVYRVWPTHVAGLPAAILALFATCPIILAGLVTNVFYALDRQGRHLVVLGVTAIAAYALGAAGVFVTDGSIAGAVAGTIGAMVGYYFAATIAALDLLPSQTRGKAIRMSFASLVPSLCVIGVLIVLTLFVPGWLRGDIVGGAVALLATMLVLVPFGPGALRALRGVRADRAAA